MSEVRTNSITDAAGTGAPDFPNGVNAATALIVKVDETERMRIDSSGNVGIGTATPTDLVQLVGGNILIGTDSGDPFNTQSRVRIQGAGSEYIQIKGDGTGNLGLLLGDATDNFLAGILSSQPENNLIFHAGNAERVRIAETGYVGIGTDTPNLPLDVTASGTGSTIISRFYINDGTVGLLRVANSTTGDGSTAPSFGSNGTDAVIHTNNTEKLRVTSGGVLQFNSGYGSVAPAYGCRAWVNFNGTGTVAIRASGNVSSITDNGVGNYTVNFTTAMPDANFATVVSAMTADGLGGVRFNGAGATTTSSVKVYCTSDARAGADAALINVAVFR